MSASTRRQERTITVDTQALGAIRVRRISLGGMARIAERMRAEGSHDETALGEALVAEVVVAGLEGRGGAGTGEAADDASGAAGEDLAARLARLSDEDRRSIAAAVLTLEGVKGAGDGVFEDPRATLARRYSHVLETRRDHETPAQAAPDSGAGHGPAAAPQGEDPGAGQIALFENLQPPRPPPAGEPARAAPSARAPQAWESERASLQAEVADLEALLARQAEQRDALEASVGAAGEQVRDAQRVARGQRWLAAAALALVVVVAGAQFIWIGVLRRDVAEQRAQFEARLQTQQQALEEAQRAAAQANARAERLAATRTPASAKSGAPAKGAAATKSSTRRSTPAKSSPAKSPPAKASSAGAASKP
jgi:hypothetical protein